MTGDLQQNARPVWRQALPSPPGTLKGGHQTAGSWAAACSRWNCTRTLNRVVAPSPALRAPSPPLGARVHERAFADRAPEPERSAGFQHGALAAGHSFAPCWKPALRFMERDGVRGCGSWGRKRRRTRREMLSPKWRSPRWLCFSLSSRERFNERAFANRAPEPANAVWCPRFSVSPAVEHPKGWTPNRRFMGRAGVRGKLIPSNSPASVRSQV